jgi:hypothetical protein
MVISHVYGTPGMSSMNLNVSLFRVAGESAFVGSLTAAARP